MLLSREFHQISPNPPLLQVFHWNILSDQLSGFFPSVEDRFLDWSHRKVLISSDLQNCQADILCLSEVDHYEDFIQPLLASKGYSSVFKKKKQWHRDGLCIAYKIDRLRFVHQQPVYFPNSNQFALFVLLTLGTIQVLVVSTHLKSGREYEKDRETQARFLLQRIERTGVRHVVLCGDFNCEPDSLTYTAIKNHKLRLASAYFGCLVQEAEPEITTYKKREVEEEYKTIDYIFVKGFVVGSVLKLPGLKEVSKIGMPSESYPSDHLSLMCTLSLNFSHLL